MRVQCVRRYLPRKYDITVFCTLTDEQQRLYTETVRAAMQDLDGEEKKRKHVRPCCRGRLCGGMVATSLGPQCWTALVVAGLVFQHDHEPEEDCIAPCAGRVSRLRWYRVGTYLEPSLVALLPAVHEQPAVPAATSHAYAEVSCRPQVTDGGVITQQQKANDWSCTCSSALKPP